MNEPRPTPSQGHGIPQGQHPQQQGGQHPPLAQPQRVAPPSPAISQQQSRKPGIAAPPMMPNKRTDVNLDPIDLEDELGPVQQTTSAAAAVPAPSKIKMFATGMGGTHQAMKFKRATNVSGQGACRVRTFHGRLSDEGMAFMDDKVNEWLDGHLEIEVKFVTTTVGLYDAKIKEQALIVNVWY